MDEEQVLELLRAVADGVYMTASIDRIMELWWVQSEADDIARADAALLQLR